MAACADAPHRVMAKLAMPSRPETKRPTMSAVTGPQPLRARPPRAFGHAAEDLEFDFDSTDRPGLVTALLAACSAPTSAEHWWLCTVGERTAALLAVLRESQGSEVIEHRLRCEQPGCGERFDIELPYAALGVGPLEALGVGPLATLGVGPSATPAWRPVPQHIVLPRDNAPPLPLRLPTGADLRAWRRMALDPRGDAQWAMLSQLCQAGELRPQDSAHAAAALAQADPLVAFSVTSGCPACGTEAEIEVDLEALALQRLAAQQRQLLRDVHVLASRYGWSEAEVMALSPARRARYVELIADAA